MGPGRRRPSAAASVASSTLCLKLLYELIREWTAHSASLTAPGTTDFSTNQPHVSPISHTPFPHDPCRVIPNTRDALVFHIASETFPRSSNARPSR